MTKQQRSSGFMSHFRKIASATCLLSSLAIASVAHADNGTDFTQMLGDDLKAVFNNTMMIGEYRSVRDRTQTSNYTEFHFDDGSTDYKEGPQVEKGIWNLVGQDKVCYRYPESSSYTQTYCFFVYESDGCYYKYSLYAMGLNGPVNYDYWSSRAIRKGSGKSCAAPIS